MTWMRPATLFFWATIATTLALSGCSWSGEDAKESWAERKLRFERVAQTAKPLVAAIDGYVSETGRPPAGLVDVAPKYIQQIPATGLDDCPGFDYRSFSNRPARLVWYDLGSRQGKPMKKPAKFSEGDQDHAIMIFTLDSEDRIVNANIDRLPKGLKGVDFDAARWKQNDSRMLMALKLADTYRLAGMPSTVFEELLGTPDGGRKVENVPWELRINCSTGFLNRDVFFYWPSGKYPQRIYGGEVEAVTDWAYVHD